MGGMITKDWANKQGKMCIQNIRRLQPLLSTPQALKCQLFCSWYDKRLYEISYLVYRFYVKVGSEAGMKKLKKQYFQT